MRCTVRNVIVKSVKRHPIDRLVNEEGFQIYKSHEEKNIAMVLNEEPEFPSHEIINFTVVGTIGNDPFVVRLAKNIGPGVNVGEPRWEFWPMEGPVVDWSEDEFEDLVEGAASDWNYQKIMEKYE